MPSGQHPATGCEEELPTVTAVSSVKTHHLLQVGHLYKEDGATKLSLMKFWPLTVIMCLNDPHAYINLFNCIITYKIFLLHSEFVDLNLSLPISPWVHFKTNNFLLLHNFRGVSCFGTCTTILSPPIRSTGGKFMWFRIQMNMLLSSLQYESGSRDTQVSRRVGRNHWRW